SSPSWRNLRGNIVHRSGERRARCPMGVRAATGDPYRSCRTAILFALSSVYQGLPSGATVIPTGSLSLTPRPSVTTPAAVIRATLPATDWENHTEPSGAPAMPSGPAGAVSANSVSWFVDGSRKPTALLNRSVNHTAPLVAMAIPRGLPGSA